jgi:hypothetical protein
METKHNSNTTIDDACRRAQRTQIVRRGMEIRRLNPEVEAARREMVAANFRAVVEDEATEER